MDAAAATPGVDYVWISNDLASGTRHNYTGQHIHVNDADGVIIEGGFVSCFDPDITPGENTTISGAGNDGGPVFDIASAGGDVFLGNLFITGASRGSNSYGGGIFFNGQVGGALILKNTAVSLNQAAFGAGIDVEGYTSAAALVIEQNTLILNNSASQSGGGIRIAGNVRMFATDPQIWIGYNHADNGDGGGVNVVGPARADIGSPGYNGIGVVSSNTAKYGGGVSLYSRHRPTPNDFSVAQARFFSVDGSQPVQVSSNSSSAAGGAFVLFSDSHDCPNGSHCLDESDVCLFDARVNDNIAPNGSAVYGYPSSGAEQVLINQSGNCGPEAPTALGAQACQAGVACDEMIDNNNEDGGGNPTAGSMVEMASDASVVAVERLHVRGNTAGHAFSMSESNNFFEQSFTLSDSLIAGNLFGGEVVSLTTDGGASTIDRCTIADNTVGAPFVLLIDGSQATLTNSIIDQPGHSTLDFNGPPAGLTANYVLSTEIVELGTRTDVMQGEPTFVDPANNDYHLKYGSLGIDFAPAGTGSDLDRKPRSVDLTLVNNLYGPMDIGAYELQQAPACVASDTIFCNGFETEN